MPDAHITGRNALRSLAFAGPLAVLVGCGMVGPDPVRPDTPVPARFFRAAADADGSAAASDARTFWHGFGDPQLAQLVEQALAANHGLQAARANWQAARAVLAEVRGGLQPDLAATGAATRERASTSLAPGLETGARTRSQFAAGFEARWELDLFGGIARGIAGAAAQAEAAEADMLGASLAVTAEVARNYLELRGLQQQLRLARAHLDNLTRTLHLTQARLDAGRGTAFDVARAQAQVESTRATLPELAADADRRTHALAVLTGQPPGALAKLQDLPARQPQPPRLADVDAPANVLRRRPDVHAAERRLAAATAEIGVQTAALYPAVSITGFVGWSAGRAGDLGRSDTITYRVGPGIRWNLWDAGRIRARIAQSDARAQAALARYEQAVLAALQDCEDALTVLQHQQQQALALAASVDAARRAARLARIRFDAGAIDLLALLDSERQVLDADDRQVRSRTRIAVTTVALFKAFGGAWSSSAIPTAQP